MEKEFVAYELAVKLKELGFDENCFGRFYTKPKCKMFSVDEKGRHYQIKNTPKKLYTVGEYFVLNDDNAIIAPTFSQAFRWFREKGYRFNMINDVSQVDGDYFYGVWFNGNFIFESHYIYKTYEEAELACLTKLIEIVEQQNQK